MIVVLQVDLHKPQLIEIEVLKFTNGISYWNERRKHGIGQNVSCTLGNFA